MKYVTKKPFPSIERSSVKLELIHSNICELNGILTRGGNRYLITFIDDHYIYNYVYLMKTKDQAFDMFMYYKSEVDNQTEKKIKVLRSDRVENISLLIFLLFVRLMELYTK